MIEDLWVQRGRGLEEWKQAPLTLLVTHIVEHYHLGARMEMARMETLAGEAVLLEGAGHPELLLVRDEITRFGKEFRAHMTLEEQSLFPYILNQAQGQAACGHEELMQPLRKLLEDEHEAETDLFRRLRTLAEPIPPGGGRTLQGRLHRSLKAMETSLHGHIYLENQVLFRRI